MVNVKASCSVLLMCDLEREAVSNFLSRFSVDIEWLAPAVPIKGSFWGGSEAGIIGSLIYVRDDTPVHSLLHETCHIICMDPELRVTHTGNAGSDDLEEAAVCYLQILLADSLSGVGRDRLMSDMDAWGYSFRLGSSVRWFTEDAEDAREWLQRHQLIDSQDQPSYELRGNWQDEPPLSYSSQPADADDNAWS